jgi:hypothetical protein
MSYICFSTYADNITALVPISTSTVSMQQQQSLHVSYIFLHCVTAPAYVLQIYCYSYIYVYVHLCLFQGGNECMATLHSSDQDSTFLFFREHFYISTPTPICGPPLYDFSGPSLAFFKGGNECMTTLRSSDRGCTFLLYIFTNIFLPSIELSIPSSSLNKRTFFQGCTPPYYLINLITFFVNIFVTTPTDQTI